MTFNRLFASQDTPLVPFDHFHIGQQMMGKQHRLSTLQMRIAGHRDHPIGLRLGDENALKLF